jgi:hypothetical protein
VKKKTKEKERANIFPDGRDSFRLHRVLLIIITSAVSDAAGKCFVQLKREGEAEKESRRERETGGERERAKMKRGRN